jgi:gluconolactonase
VISPAEGISTASRTALECPKDRSHSTFSSVKAGTFIPGNGGPDGMHYDVHGNLWAASAGLGGIIQINPRGVILGFVPIPNNDAATTNFAFGGPDQRDLLALQGALSRTGRRSSAGATIRAFPR